MNIYLERAVIDDADRLTDIMKRTFDEEAKRWLSHQEGVLDYNIQPPGYTSVVMTKYMINELEYFKIMMNEELVGGIILTITGNSYGRIDRIFIAPECQGKGVGTAAIRLVKEKYHRIRFWDLETSSRQRNNHHFYEKMGYKRVFQTEEEYCYKKAAVKNRPEANQHENREMPDSEFYSVNLSGSSFSNSNIEGTSFSNCNLSHSRFQNINLQNSLYADLNFSRSRFMLVNLGGVTFQDTTLEGEGSQVHFMRCDLKGTIITNSSLRNAEINDCNLSGMKINGILVEEMLEAYSKVNRIE
ncbi:GNAT family N-acetyltransferase [Rossellomorea vietnamensis]|uniref:GNAT family N-acetyltransferase n=1 Tax=Rossellomorea vietnamensis TaxID=218284 RepID=A0A5D4ME62_9BACI|nr:GNAT family N-acetyltransferase [Rossellomorea vietnamensis]TYR99315.1 GNAT family N-acetyltransferase [Rossellomorea vietnamensis]